MADAPAIRPATAADYSAFAELFPELGNGDPTPGEDRWRDELMPTALIAERAGRAVGYCYFQVLRGTAYVRHLVVAPAERGRGVGRGLMRAMADHFRAAGARDWRLNVKVNNAPAIRLYESFGMRAAYRSAAMRVSWSAAEALTGVSGLTARAITPEDDASVERAFPLPEGQLEDARRQPGRVLMQLEDGSHQPLGVAIFNPAFPGAFPFRLARPALVDAGAAIRLQMFHFRGPLQPFARPSRSR